MRALRFHASERSLRIDAAAPVPSPAPGEALIRPHRLGVTATERAIVAGALAPHFSGILGHEFVGTVESINLPADPPPTLRDKQALKGRRVVASPIIACGACDMCRAGLSQHCRSRAVVGLSGRDGVFAERICLPLSNLQPVPETVPDDQAILAYSLVRAAHAAQFARAAARGFITVLADPVGDPTLALLIAQVLALSNRSTRLLSSNPAALGVCERWGLKHRPIEEAGRRQDQDAVVVCSASPAPLRTAMQMVRPRGTIVMASPTLLEPLPPGRPFPEVAPGSPGAAAMLDLAPLMVGEISLIGCRDGPATASALAEALTLLAPGGGIDAASLIARRVKFDDAPAALTAAAPHDHLGLAIEL